jgi:hypothetical protein
MGIQALNLPDLAVALEGEVPGGVVIIDRTVLDGVRPPYRTIEVHHNNWNGPLLGAMGEYPTSDAPLHFAPMASIPYGDIVGVIEALESHGVVIDDPAR